MDFEKQLIEKLKDKGVTETSTKLYLKNVNRLNDGNEIKNFKFLSDIDKIKEKLNKYRDNTKRSYIISILALLSLDKDKNKKLYELYYNEMKERNKIYNDRENKNEPTETQAKNWISQDTVKDTLNKAIDKIKDIKISKNMSKDDYNNLLDVVVLGLYVYHPPRRNSDYLDMEVVNKYKDDMSKDKNYLDLSKKKFIFNKYKSMKKHGQQIEDINNDYLHYLNMYLKYWKLKKSTNNSLLKNYEDANFQINGITYILNKLFGKRVGSSMLRHVFLTDKYGDILKDQKETADAMAHSVSQQKKYIKDI